MNEMKELPKLHIEGMWFVDEFSRKVLLRGINISGDSKLPYTPNGATQIKENWPPTDIQNDSWIGRPFPLEEADEHFTRLKAWGFNCLRFLTTWEAIEHAGPYQYDEPYLDYFAKLVEEAGKYGFYVFVDPHEDVWSRVTGGDGAPLWLFNKVGLDYTKFDDADAAVTMQGLYDPDPDKNKYEHLAWFQNAFYFPTATMWTLFFGGRDFAPNLKLEDEASGEFVNIQDYLQKHYIESVKQIAKRVKDMPHVFGFDSMNEPGTGFIGRPMTAKKTDLPGLNWSCADTMFVAAGNSMDVEELELNVSGIKLKGVKKINPKAISIWNSENLEDADFWAQHNVWKYVDGRITAPNEEYFQVVGGKTVNFNRDYLAPFLSRFTKHMREINAEWIIMAEGPPGIGLSAPPSGENLSLPDNVVNAFHWYDMTQLVLNKFTYPVHLDMTTFKPIIGWKKIQESYLTSFANSVKWAEKINNGNCPSLVGEFGLLFNMEDGKAYKNYAKQGQAAFKLHTKILDLMYNCLDALNLNGTLWNYTPENSNQWGDNHCLEDLSIFSRDQQKPRIDQEKIWRQDINSGGRALAGFCRPYPRYIAGDLEHFAFDLKRGTVSCKFHSDNAIQEPTELFVPKLQYPAGFSVKCTGIDWEHDENAQILYLKNPKLENIDLHITRNKS